MYVYAYVFICTLYLFINVSFLSPLEMFITNLFSKGYMSLKALGSGITDIGT